MYLLVCWLECRGVCSEGESENHHTVYHIVAQKVPVMDLYQICAQVYLMDVVNCDNFFWLSVEGLHLVEYQKTRIAINNAGATHL